MTALPTFAECAAVPPGKRTALQTFICNYGIVLVINRFMDNQPLLDQLAVVIEEERKGWRCFHCGSVFTDEAAARDHFGSHIYRDTVCALDAHYLREIEEQLTRYRTEDTELERRLHAMQAEHIIALRREEETGYARGIADMCKERDALTARLAEARALLTEWSDYDALVAQWLKETTI